MTNIFTAFENVTKPKHLYTGKNISDALMAFIGLPRNKPTAH